jgi:hypothetical protein
MKEDVMNEIISMFIDNELSIDEKLSLLERLKVEPDFFSEAVSLLEQEKLLRAEGLYPAPSLAGKAPAAQRGRLKDVLTGFFRPLLQPAGAMAVLAIAVLGFYLAGTPAPPTAVCPSRLVVYQPDAKEVAVAGAFTAWQAVPMRAAGASGYWEITLDIPGGEHRFVYIADGHRRFVDPTVLTREQDDFGGENGILIVEQST